jgi:hypothetical protein
MPIFLLLLLAGGGIPASPDQGRHLYLDGIDDYAYRSSGSISLPSGDFTIELEFACFNLEDNPFLFDALGSTAGDGIEVQLANYHIELSMNDNPSSPNEYTLSSVTLANGQHYHLAITYDGTSGETNLFLNGIKYSAFASQVFEARNSLYLGRRDYTSAGFFAGYLDDIHVSDTIRYTTDFTPSHANPSSDGNTLALFLFNEEGGASSFASSAGSWDGLYAQADATTRPYETIDFTRAWAYLGSPGEASSTDSFDFSSTALTLEFDARFERGASGTFLKLNPAGPKRGTPKRGAELLTIYADGSGPSGSIALTAHLNGQSFPLGESLEPATWYRLTLEWANGLGKQAGANGARWYANGYQTNALTSSTLPSGIHDLILDGANVALDNMALHDVSRGTSAFFPSPMVIDGDTLAVYRFDETDDLPASFADALGSKHLSASDVESAECLDEPRLGTLTLTGGTAYYLGGSLSLPTSWSLEFWLNHQGSTVHQTLFDNSQGGTSGLSLFLNSSNILLASINGSNYPLMTLPTHTWAHVMVTFEDGASLPSAWLHKAGVGGIVRGYRDGVRTFQTDGVEFSNSANPLRLGNGFSAVTGLIGEMDDLRLCSLRSNGHFSPPHYALEPISLSSRLWHFDESDPAVFSDELASATLSYCTGIVISPQPASQNTCTGASVTLACDVTDGSPDFQWYKDSTLIPGATSHELTFDPVSLADGGTYMCRISNACESVDTANAVLTVNEGVTLNSSASPSSLCVGDPLSLTVSATYGAGTLGYQWHKNGAPLSGETHATFAIAAVTQADSGAFHCLITPDNGCPAVHSGTYVVTVEPTIVEVDSPETICWLGGSASLNSTNLCGTSGSYAWTGPGTIDSPASASTSVTPPATRGAYNYQLTFTPTLGPTIIRNVLVLEIEGDWALIGDGDIDLDDLLEMVSGWPANYQSQHDVAPVSAGDGRIDVRDLVLMTPCL